MKNKRIKFPSQCSTKRYNPAKTAIKKASHIRYHLLVSFRQLKNTYPFASRKIKNSIPCINSFLKMKNFRHSPSKTAGIMTNRKTNIIVFRNGLKAFLRVDVLLFLLINPFISKVLLFRIPIGWIYNLI